MSETTWSETEKEIAHRAFQRAYEREIQSLMDKVRNQVNEIDDIGDVWHLHDFLSARRHQIDGKYDYRYSVLIFVFAQLLQEGWLYLDDLDGLEPDKRAKIAALARL